MPDASESRLLPSLWEHGVLLTGHFVLPDGRYSDTAFDRFRILEDPRIATPLIEVLADMLRPSPPTTTAGASLGGCIVASQVARILHTDYIALEYSEGLGPVDAGTDLHGRRIAVFDDFGAASAQFDQVIRLLRARGGEVVCQGVLVTLKGAVLDLYDAPFISAVTVDAKIFEPDKIPHWLEAVEVQELVDWRKQTPGLN